MLWGGDIQFPHVPGHKEVGEAYPGDAEIVVAYCYHPNLLVADCVDYSAKSLRGVILSFCDYAFCMLQQKNQIECLMDEMAAPQCTKCSRFNLDHSCLAFPSGIPDEIFLGAFDHRKPYSGDDGFMFDKISKHGLAGNRQDESSIGEGGIVGLIGGMKYNDHRNMF